VQSWKPYAALVALCFLWGTTYLAIKIGIHHFPVFLFSGLRNMIAGALVMLWFIVRGTAVWPSGLELRRIIISGSFIFIGGNLFLCLAEQQVPSGLAAMVNTAFPLWIVIMTRILNPSEKTPVMALVGIVIGFIGQFLIFYEQLFLLQNSAYFVGFIFLVGGVINGATGSVYMKRNPVKTQPIFTGGIQMLICGSVTALIGVARGEVSQLNADPQGWMAMAYLIVAGSMMGYSFFVYALHNLPAAMVSVYAYVNPLVALWLGWLLLNEPISHRTIYAMIVTMIGVYIVGRGMQRARQQSLVIK
jgi:drug/metabolite transporter (DMT)-like permease